MSDELKPCLLCGRDPRNEHQLFKDVMNYEAPGTRAMSCTKCGASGPGKATVEESNAAWNRRGPAPEAKALAEAVEDVIDWYLNPTTKHDDRVIPILAEALAAYRAIYPKEGK